MGNPVKYVKDLEAAGFPRNQAEAQVQLVLDMTDSNLVTKNDFAVFQERMDNRFIQFEQRIQNQMKDLEFRLTMRLGVMMVSSLSVAVAVLAWIIKV